MHFILPQPLPTIRHKRVANFMKRSKNLELNVKIEIGRVILFRIFISREVLESPTRFSILDARLCKKDVLRNFAKFRPANLLKKRLWHEDFPVNFEKFLGTPFFIEHLLWLLLFLSRSGSHINSSKVGLKAGLKAFSWSQLAFFLQDPTMEHILAHDMKTWIL